MALVEAVYLTLALLLAAFLCLSVYMRARYPGHAHLPWMIASIGAMAATLLLAALGLDSNANLSFMLVLFTASAALTCKTFIVLTGSAHKRPWSLAIAATLTGATCIAIGTGYAYIHAVFPFHIAIGLLMGEAGLRSFFHGRETTNGSDHINKAITVCLAAMAAVFTLRGIGLLAFFDSAARFSDIKQSGYELATMMAMAVPGMTLTLLLIFRTLDQAASQYRTASQTDALTGLMNRGAFSSATASAADGSWLILCDIDHFKRVNDSWGHAAGDMALRCFGSMLRGVNMACGRIGGEEFAIFLPFATGGQARLIAEGLRTAFSLRQIDGLPADARLTASFGIAGWEEGDTFDSLFKRADAALYQAKAEGRDRVVLSESRKAEEQAGILKAA